MARWSLPASIIDITENAFWRGVRAPGRGHVELKRAIAHGNAGASEDAYAALADYHRTSLADVWAEQCKAWEAAGPVDEAEIADLLRNRIRGWHATVVDFGETIDWNTRAFGSSGLYGFHYMGWVTPAVRQYALTGDERVGAWLARTIRGAFDARHGIEPALGMHPIYYELGARAKLLTMPQAYLALINRGGATPECCEAVLKLILGCARSLQALQQGYRHGNWQIAGCGALIQAASWFPEFAESKAWLETGVRGQREHLEQDFFADGCHGERCFGYMHMSVSSIAGPYQAARRIGGYGKEEDAFFRARLRRSYRWLAKALGPKGLHPAVGDCHFGAAPGMLDDGRPFFPKDADQWLGVDRGQSYFFKPSGFAAMRNGAGDEACYLFHTFGPWSGWHSHLDTTSLSLYAHGEPLLEEVGRFESYDNPRSHAFRAPECHNMVSVEGAHFDNTDAKWRAGQRPAWLSTPEIDFLTVRHQAYRHHGLEPQSSNITVRRTTVFVKDPGYALVFDTAIPEDTPNPEFALAQN
ncbi:MAG: heparinase II/III family protein [Armatimonadota bacterium]